MANKQNSTSTSSRKPYKQEKYNPEFVAYVKIPLPVEYENNCKKFEIPNLFLAIVSAVHAGYRVSLELRPDDMVQASLYGLHTRNDDDNGLGVSCVAATEREALIGVLMKLDVAGDLSTWGAQKADRTRGAW